MSVRDKLRGLLAPIKRQKKPSPRPEKPRLNSWEQLEQLYQAVNSSPLDYLKETLDELIKNITFYEQVGQDQKEFNDLRFELEEIFKSIQEMPSTHLYSGGRTRSTYNICRSIRGELGGLTGTREHNKIQQHAEVVANVRKRDVLECYHHIKSLLKRLYFKPIKQLTWTDVYPNHWLLTGSALYNSVEGVDLGRGPCIPGTRTGILAHILSCVDALPAGSIYWVWGATETGKTTIAYSICQELDSCFTLAASFFCSRWIPRCQDISRIVPCIAYQLAQYSYPYRWALARAYENAYNISSLYPTSPILQIETLLTWPLREVENVLPQNPVIVIDALLDECDDGESALQLLLLLIQAELPLILVIFSQPQQETKQFLENLGAKIPSRIVIQNLDDAMVQADIETYLRTTLDHLKPPPSAISNLLKRAGSSFTYTTTAVQLITTGKLSRNASERLDAILRTPADPSLAYHAEIGMIYSAVLEGVFEYSNLDTKKIISAQHILHVVTFSGMIWTTAQIARLLNIDLDLVTVILNLLAPVIRIIGCGRHVAPLHTSFLSYLRNSHLLKKYFPEGNSILALRCFEMIRDTKPQFNIRRLSSSYDLDDLAPQSLLSQGIIDGITLTQEVLYACLNWGYHMSASPGSTDLGTRLKEFLSCHLLLWLEILNLTQNGSKALEIINFAEEWIVRHIASPETINLVKAASRFVRAFVTNPISQSTPHLYISLLPSLPLLDPISRLYGKRIQGGVRITGTALEQPLMLRNCMGGQVYSVAFAPNGTRLALGVGNFVQLVDASSGRLFMEPFEGHTWSVMTVTYSPDGAYIASGSRDKTIRVWDSHTGKLVMGPLIGHIGHVRCVVYSPRGTCIVSGSNDTTIRVWDADTGQMKLGPLSGHIDSVTSIVPFSDDSRIVSGSKDGTIRIWDLLSGDLLFEPLGGHTDCVTSVALLHDDSRIVSGSADHTIRVWDSETRQMVLGPLTGHSDWVHSVALTPDDAYIVSGSSDCTVRIWDSTTGRPVVKPLLNHESHVFSVACSPNEPRFVSGSGDETLCFWIVPSPFNSPLEIPLGHSKAVRSVCVSPAGTHFVSGSIDQTICVWDLTQKAMTLGPLRGHTGAVNSVCYTYDGKMIVSGSDDGTVRFWDANTGEPVAVRNPFNRLAPQIRVNSVACASNISLIASGASNGAVSVWSSDTRRLLLEAYVQPGSSVQSVQFSCDGSRIVAGSMHGIVNVLSRRTGTVILGPFRGFNMLGGMASVGYSPDGTRIIARHQDGRIYLWNALTGQLQLVIQAGFVKENLHLSSQFSPDGTLIASGSADNTLSLWDAQSGKKILGPLRGHTGPVNPVSFLPDGTHLVSASSDNDIRVWDIKLRSSLPRPKYSNWAMEEDGWVVVKESGRPTKRLAWVDPKFRNCLLTHRNTALFSRSGYVKVDFEGALIGESWSKIYQPA